jgi:hypothetical protein
MAATYTLISSQVLATSAASVTFSSIPQTYTDLVLKVSARTDLANPTDFIDIAINSSTDQTYSTTSLSTRTAGSSLGYQSTSGSSTYYIGSGISTYTDAASATSSTFGSSEFYFPNYTSSAYKVISNFSVSENNAVATALMAVGANLRSSTAAITGLKITSDAAANFVSGSSFYLYGISNS